MREALLGVSRGERALSAAIVLAALALLAAFPAWRMTDPPPAYALEPVEFLERTRAFAARYAAEEGTAAPPPGDVFLAARRYEFWPALILEAGQTYRLHASSLDGVHSLAVDGRELLLVPGEVRVLELAPAAPGLIDIRCNEYCGLGHNKMRAEIVVR